MIVYQYSPAGLYQGETVADESPLEPGVWLMPARTTRVAPPSEYPEERWPRWNGGPPGPGARWPDSTVPSSWCAASTATAGQHSTEPGCWSPSTSASSRTS